MHFYRPLHRIAALTFDLDDTLYDNWPVIERTEAESLRFVQGYHPGLSKLTSADFAAMRRLIRDEQPDIYHDVTAWRHASAVRLLSHHGLDRVAAMRGADDIMANFAQWRSQITVPQETHDTLARLAEKWLLVAITNGNADPAACGLDGYFQFVLRAGPDGRSKPFSDMFDLAARRLDIMPGEILHVGDDLTTDVAGAVLAGAQACWINLNATNLMHHPASRLLPHVEISRLASLTALL